MICESANDPLVHTAGHAYYDQYCHEKQAWGVEMVQTHMVDAADRSLAERFAPSACNFGLLVGQVADVGLKAAEPEKIAKLFQPCKNPGGSKWLDLTAQKWQQKDRTYQATGSKVI